jgi:hypothetical protein
MNISRRDIKMLLILFGIGIFVLCYFFVYATHTEENEYLLEDIEDAGFEYSRLKALENRVPYYRESVASTEEFILAAQAEYPSDIHAADLIMFAVEIAENVGIGTGGITFIQPVEIMTLRGLSENAQGNYAFAPQTAYRTGIVMSCSLTYQELKDLVNYIYNESVKASIHSISLSYNSATGLLHGSVVINRSFISSEDAEYVAAQIPEMRIGLPNPFGVIRPAAPAPTLPPSQPFVENNYEETD